MVKRTSAHEIGQISAKSNGKYTQYQLLCGVAFRSWFLSTETSKAKWKTKRKRQKFLFWLFAASSLLQDQTTEPTRKEEMGRWWEEWQTQSPTCLGHQRPLCIFGYSAAIRLFGKTKEEISDALAIKVLLFTIFNLSPSHCFWFFLLKIPESLPEVLWEKNQVCVFRGIRVQPSALLQVFCIFPFEFNTLIIDTLLLLIRVTNVIYNYEQGK